MKKTKLKIENFLENTFENQITIIGGGDRTLEAPLEGSSGGSTVSSGSGAGHDGETPITADLIIADLIPELPMTP